MSESIHSNSEVHTSQERHIDSSFNNITTTSANVPQNTDVAISDGHTDNDNQGDELIESGQDSKNEAMTDPIDTTEQLEEDNSQELEEMLNEGYNTEQSLPVQETAFTSEPSISSSLDNLDSEKIPDIIRTISAGSSGDKNPDLQSKPTTALSYVDTTGLAVPSNSIAHPSNRKRRESISSILSPAPTLLMEHTSEVATLLSEVLDADNEGQMHSPRTINHALRNIDEGPVSSSSSAMSFFDTGYSNQTASVDNETDESSEQQESNTFLQKKKQYFILSSAGKPIYSMNGSDELITGYMGIFQAIVSYFDLGPSMNGNSTNETSAPSSNKSTSVNKNNGREQLKSVKAGNTLFVFSIEDPLILIAVDKLGESEYQLRAQLDVLYAQILSTLTKSQLSKVFQGRNNFDLRQLLGGTEVFLSALTREMSFGSPGILLGSLECLRLRKSIRNKINNILIERRTKSLLYGMIVADSRLVSVIRPRRHSLHPPDLHLVFSMLFNTTSFSKGGEHWVPICLPKFNSTGFLYAYIYFFVPEVALVLISPDKNSFFEMRECKEQILQDLEQGELITPITQSLHKGRFNSLDIPVPLVKHFLYKSKTNVQFLMPSFETHYYDTHERHKLMVLYHQLHGAVHPRQGHLKVYHTTRRNTTALAWVTPTFEIYCVTGNTTKEAISQSVRAIVSWVKHNEERLFVIGGAVF